MFYWTGMSDQTNYVLSLWLTLAARRSEDVETSFPLERRSYDGRAFRVPLDLWLYLFSARPRV